MPTFFIMGADTVGTSVFLEKLQPLVEPVVEDEGLELVDLEWMSLAGQWVLRVYMDKEGGVTLDDCQRVSRRLNPVLDVEDLIPSRYNLEVSSPGLNRRLKKASDFRRFLGRRARIELSSSLQGRRRFRGKLAGISGEEETEIVLEMEGGEVVHLPLADIGKARLEVEL